MIEMLFDISDSTKNFGIDANGLLTCSEKDYARTYNPYVALVKMAGDDDRIQTAISVVVSVKEQLESEPWFREAQAKGKAPNNLRMLAVGGFSKDEILKAAYVAQTIRFGERSYEYISAIVKSRIDGNSKEVYEQILNEIVKDMPKFEHPALQAYDPDSAKRMKEAIDAKYGKYVDAYVRRVQNCYATFKRKFPNYPFNAETDKNTLLEILDDKRLAFLEDQGIRLRRIKHKSASDLQAFFLKNLHQN